MDWDQVGVAAAVIVLALLAARLVDRRMARRQHAPDGARLRGFERTRPFAAFQHGG